MKSKTNIKFEEIGNIGMIQNKKDNSQYGVYFAIALDDLHIVLKKQYMDRWCRYIYSQSFEESYDNNPQEKYNLSDFQWEIAYEEKERG